MFNFLGRWFQRQCRHSQRRGTSRCVYRTRPRLEVLEDRVVPAVINVNSTADVALNALAPGQVTLRDAIQIANTNGDATNVINLTVAGNYQIQLAGTAGETDNQAGEFSIFNNATAATTGLNLTIQNTSGGAATINANSLSRVFDINANNAVPANNGLLGTVTISGVTIENGLAQPGDAAGGSGGGIRDVGPVSLTLNNDIVTNNNATADGGGIAMENAASTRWTLTLNATTVSGNHAGDAGGGIDEDGTGKVFINAGSVIADNTTVNQGAGIWLDALNGGTANLTINGAYIAGNTAGMLGGGAGNAGNGAVTILNSTFQDNTSTGFGGGFADENNLGTLTVQNSLFVGNKAGTNGGAIQEGNGTIIANSEIENNAAGVNGMMPIGTTGKGAANAVEGSGGGLFINGGTLTLTSSTIADNTAEINGGGIELQTTGATTITNSTIAFNTALFNTPSTAGAPSVFLNDGGGIDDAATGTVALIDDTVSNNFANNGGGIFFAGTTGLRLQNTIVARNTVSGAGPDLDFTGTVAGVDLGGNLIGVSGAGSGNAGFTAGTTQTGTVGTPLDPLLADLEGNGGPQIGSSGHQITLQTEALLPGSPAIGKGMANGVLTDERGFVRHNPPSVGAFEFNAITPTATPAANLVTPAVAGNVTLVVTSTTDSLNQVGTLRNAIQTANADLANGTATSVTISIQTAGLYQIKLAGTPGETDNAAGEFALFTSPNTPVGSSLTIQNDSGGAVTIDGGNQTRVFDINPTNLIPANNVVLGAVTINGVTIENGLAQPGDGAAGSGGGIRDQGPVDLTLNNDSIINSSASADGGGIAMENATSTKWALTLNATTVSGNHAGDAGGGIDEDGTGKVFVNAGSVIRDNTTINQGAGIWLDAINGGAAALTVTGAYVVGNSAGQLAGGLGNAGTGNVVIITNSTLQDNTSTGFGGGFADENNGGVLNVQNSLFQGNKAGTNGGAIQEGKSTNITNSEFRNNAAGVNGMMAIGSSLGVGNPVEGSGGGLFINGGFLSITSSTIANNTAEINGGGIEVQTTAPSGIMNSTIVGNTALFNTPSTAAAPSVFLNNGGGIDDAATTVFTIMDDTLANNFANNGGGIFFAGSTGGVVPLVIQGTILAHNIASTTGPDADFTGVLTGVDKGGNLVGVSGPGSGNTGVFTAGTTQTGTVANPLDPLVTGLTNNGGPLAGSTGHQITVETAGLSAGSPAIGKGVANGENVDERGFPRLNPPSIGAFEFQNTTLTVTVTPASPTLALNNSENVAVTITNTGANALPVDNSTVDVALAAGGTRTTTFTATLGALASGQGQTFTVTVNGTALGQQTVTGTVTSPDTNPATATGSATVTVTPTPTPTPTPTTPVGTLTVFAFGFGPGGGIDLFEVDTRGDVFAVPFMGGGGPLFINTTVQLPVVAFVNGQLLAFLHSSAGQNFLIDIVNPFNPFVLGPVLAGLHL
jgi:hypothetical protein